MIETAFETEVDVGMRFFIDIDECSIWSGKLKNVENHECLLFCDK